MASPELPSPTAPNPPTQMGNCTAKGASVDCSSIHATAVGTRLKRVGREGGHVLRIVMDSCRVIPAGDPDESKFQRRETAIPRYFEDSNMVDQEGGQTLANLGKIDISSPNGGNLHQVLLPLGPAGSPCVLFGVLRRLEVLPCSIKGVWRVRLAIAAEHLADILTKQVDTEALIEMTRMFACSQKVIVPLQLKHAGEDLVPVLASEKHVCRGTLR